MSPCQSWLEMAHVLGAAQAPPGTVTWPKASAGNACPGWMPVLEQSTNDADGGCSQTPGTPCWSQCLGRHQHPDYHGAPWGFGSDVVAWSKEYLKIFTRRGLILLPLDSSHVHFPFHCNHLLLLKLDKYFLSPRCLSPSLLLPGDIVQ